MITVKSIELTCHSHPAQWEGRTDDGRPIYVRYRWSYLSVMRVGGTDGVDQIARCAEAAGREDRWAVSAGSS